MFTYYYYYYYAVTIRLKPFIVNWGQTLLFMDIYFRTCYVALSHCLQCYSPPIILSTMVKTRFAFVYHTRTSYAVMK